MGNKLSACDCRKGHGPTNSYQPITTTTQNTTTTPQKPRTPTIPQTITPKLNRERTSSLSLLGGWDEEATVHTELSSASKSIQSIRSSSSSSSSSPLRRSPSLGLSYHPRGEEDAVDSTGLSPAIPTPRVLSSRFEEDDPFCCPTESSDLDDSSDREQQALVVDDERGSGERAFVAVFDSTDTSKTEEDTPIHTNNEKEEEEGPPNRDDTTNAVSLNQKDPQNKKETQDATTTTTQDATTVPIVDSPNTSKPDEATPIHTTTTNNNNNNTEQEAAAATNDPPNAPSSSPPPETTTPLTTTTAAAVNPNPASSHATPAAESVSSLVVSGDDNNDNDNDNDNSPSSKISPTIVVSVLEQVVEGAHLSRDQNDGCVSSSVVPAPPVADSMIAISTVEQVRIPTQNVQRKEEEPRLVTNSTLRFTTLDLPGVAGNVRLPPGSSVLHSNPKSIQDKTPKNIISLTLPEYCNSRLCLTQTARFAVLDLKD